MVENAGGEENMFTVLNQPQSHALPQSCALGLGPISLAFQPFQLTARLPAVCLNLALSACLAVKPKKLVRHVV